MLAILALALALPLVGATELDLALPDEQVLLGRVHSRVERYRRGELLLPVPVEHQGTVELAVGLGAQLYRLDTAAVRASAALARAGAVEDPRLQGWLCVDAGDDVHVVFVGIDPAVPDTPGGLYHAVVDLDAGSVGWGDFAAEGAAAPLRAEPGPPRGELFPFDTGLLREWQAHQAVLRSQPSASERPLDPVVVQVDPTPGAEAYLVFLLARSVDPRRIQFGGHAAYMVRFEGDRLGIKPYAISKETISWDRRELHEASAEDRVMAGFFRRSPELSVPRELHVYESLVYELPFFLLAERDLWYVEGARLGYLGRVD
jgi:hypothetical protein